MKKGIFQMLMLVMALTVTVLIGGTTAQAAKSPLETLQDAIVRGNFQPKSNGGADTDKITLTAKETNKQFIKEDGGYYLYKEMVDSKYKDTGLVNPTRFEELKKSSRTDLLKEIIQFCTNIEASVSANNNDGKGTTTNSKSYITTDTVNQYYQTLQNLSGAGTTLIQSMVANVKPDYATGNKILKPFNGVAGTILGVLSILIMTLLALTMANDIAFIVIPAYQLLLGADGSGGSGGSGNGEQGGAAKAASRMISIEARSAVQAVEGGGGGGGQQGSNNKIAVGIYFKHRWKALVVLGICLLYLVAGNIMTLVGWILDLVSGFTGI